MMQVHMVFDPIAKTALITFDGEVTVALATDVSPFMDHLIYNVVHRGWTILIGHRNQEPELLTPEIVRTLFESRGGGSSPPPAPVDPSTDPTTEMFRSWVEKPKSD